MDFIINNWMLIAGVIVITVSAVLAIIKFVKGSKEEQLKDVREWLLYATSIAEKELGGGTGKLKLRFVYDMFVVKFPWLARVITFEYFSELVDDALEEMKSLLATNSAVQVFVNGNNDSK